MKKGPFKIIDKPKFFVIITLSDCWTIKGKPVAFRVKRLRKPPVSDGWVCVSFILCYMISIHIAFVGEIK